MLKKTLWIQMKSPGKYLEIQITVNLGDLQKFEDIWVNFSLREVWYTLLWKYVRKEILLLVLNASKRADQQQQHFPVCAICQLLLLDVQEMLWD